MSLLIDMFLLFSIVIQQRYYIYTYALYEHFLFYFILLIVLYYFLYFVALLFYAFMRGQEVVFI
jgi:hypothetical protein